MRIVEIKSQNVKIIFKPTEQNLVVGDFLSFTEGEKTLIAQVYAINSCDEFPEYDYAELNFLLNKKFGKVYPWDGENISSQAIIDKTPWSFIEAYINRNNAEELFALGYCAGTNERPLRLSFNNFQVPAFVGYENQSDNDAFLGTIANQFDKVNKKLLVIDFNGNIEIDGAKRLMAGFEMKLPLSYDILENLMPKMVDGVSAETRAVIEDILFNLASYAKETSDFISINSLIKVIDNIYKELKISQLILFKNKLRSYQRQNIFADNPNEPLLANLALQEHNVVILDLSNIPAEWQNEFLNCALKMPENTRKDFYLYLMMNSNLDKNLLNYLVFKSVKNGIKPILATNYRFMEMDTILDFCQNAFLFHAQNELKNKAHLNSILGALPQDYFVIYGKLSSSMPMVSYLGEPIESLDAFVIEEKIRETNETLDIIQKSMPVETFEEPQEEIPNVDVDMNAINTAFEQQEQIVEEEQPLVEDADNSDFQVELVQSEDNLQPEPQIEKEEDFDETIVDDIVTPQETFEIEEVQAEEEFIEEEVEMPEDILVDEYQEVSVEPTTETAMNDIEFTEDDDFLDEMPEQEQAYTQSDEDELLDLLSDADYEDTEETSSIEDINIDDVDFDDLEQENVEDYEEDFSEDKNSTEQKIPVYDAESYEQSSVDNNSSMLQKGDLVKHSKYGLGTVKKIFNRGNKLMCFVNFEDFGRRLLDVGISQLEKIQ